MERETSKKMQAALLCHLTFSTIQSAMVLRAIGAIVSSIKGYFQPPSGQIDWGEFRESDALFYLIPVFDFVAFYVNITIFVHSIII
jgi:hypothetical protein